MCPTSWMYCSSVWQNARQTAAIGKKARRQRFILPGLLHDKGLGAINTAICRFMHSDRAVFGPLLQHRTRLKKASTPTAQREGSRRRFISLQCSFSNAQEVYWAPGRSAFL